MRRDIGHVCFHPGSEAGNLAIKVLATGESIWAVASAAYPASSRSRLLFRRLRTKGAFRPVVSHPGSRDPSF